MKRKLFYVGLLVASILLFFSVNQCDAQEATLEGDIIVTGDLSVTGMSEAADAYFVFYNLATGTFSYGDTTGFGGGGATVYTFGHSLNNAAGTVTLDNDVASPGNYYYYSTSGAGAKGWNLLVDAGILDAITVNPINATTESAIEAVVDLQSLQGAVTDAQVPNSIAIDLSTNSSQLGGVAAASYATDADVAAGYEPLGVTLSEVSDQTASKTFTLGTNDLIFQISNSGKVEFNTTTGGADMEGSVHIHQHTGNPGASRLLSIESEDADVATLHISAELSDSAIYVQTGSVFIDEDIDVGGNIIVDGTVDGIDIATDVAANTAKVTNDNEGAAGVYGAGWNADTEAPTKDAVYDKIELVSASVFDTAHIYVRLDSIVAVLNDSIEASIILRLKQDTIPIVSAYIGGGLTGDSAQFQIRTYAKYKWESSALDTLVIKQVTGNVDAAAKSMTIVIDKDDTFAFSSPTTLLGATAITGASAAGTGQEITSFTNTEIYDGEYIRIRITVLSADKPNEGFVGMFGNMINGTY